MVCVGLSYAKEFVNNYETRYSTYWVYQCLRYLYESSIICQR